MLLKDDPGFAVVLPLHGDGVRGAVDVLDGVLRFQRHFQGELLQGSRRLAVGLERIGVVDHAAVALGDRGELEADFLIAVLHHRIDAQPQQVVAGVLQQGRILRAPHDARVDVTRLGRFDEFAGHLLAIDPHAQFGDGGAFGHGEDVGRLQLPIGVVAEGLLDAGDRRLIFDGDGHDMAEHGQRGDGLVVRNEQAVGGYRPCCEKQGSEGHPSSHARSFLVDRRHSSP